MVVFAAAVAALACAAVAAVLVAFALVVFAAVVAFAVDFDAAASAVEFLGISCSHPVKLASPAVEQSPPVSNKKYLLALRVRLQQAAADTGVWLQLLGTETRPVVGCLSTPLTPLGLRFCPQARRKPGPLSGWPPDVAEHQLLVQEFVERGSLGLQLPHWIPTQCRKG